MAIHCRAVKNSLRGTRRILDITSLFPSLPLFVCQFSHRIVSGSWVRKLLKPAGSHCGVDGDADGWPDEDLPCSRDTSFPILKGLSTEILFKSFADLKKSREVTL